VSEKIEHKIIKSDQCPRCGGTNTESLGFDDSLTEGRICLDCKAKSAEGDDFDCTYDVCCCEIVEAVRWVTPDGTEFGEEHEIYDSHYLAEVEALNLLRIAEQMLDYHDSGTGSNPPELMWDELRVRVANAKGERDD
jgi:hypothetical protein